MSPTRERDAAARRRREAPRIAARIAASVLALVVVTAVIDGLKEFIPALSLGALYVFAVLPVAIAWGLAYAVPVSIASMLAFNWLFLPPVHSFTLSDSRNWAALAVYLVTAVAASGLAARARRRAAEAEQRERETKALAGLATALLRGRGVDAEVGRTEAEAERVLGVGGLRIELGPPGSPRAGESPYPLEVDDRRVGTAYLPDEAEPSLSVRARFLPALASLLAVAADHERLTRDAVEAEALRRSDAIKTAVIQAVSHDLRTPLATIETSLDGLQSPGISLDEADRAELLGTMRSAHVRLKQLVDNLLDLSRLQAGAAQPVPEIWTADQLLAGTLDQLGGSERIRLAVPDDAPPVRVDAAQVERALVNVIDNALKFSPGEEPVTVRVTATRKEVVIRVVDHGPGLPAGELERVFEPFHRAETPAGQRGAGLGLAIAKGFVEANGGRIWAESQPGQGATFSVTLPIAAMAEPAGARA